jgi:hypothetical protein
LWQGLEEAADALDFERASRLRRDLQAALALTEAQRRLRESTESSWVVLVTTSAEPGQRQVMLVARGRLWAQLMISDEEEVGCLASRLSRCWDRFVAFGLGAPDHDAVDDMHILGSWLARHDGHPAILRFDGGQSDVDWLPVAKRVLSLPRDELDFDAWRKTQDTGDAWHDVTIETG